MHSDGYLTVWRDDIFRGETCQTTRLREFPESEAQDCVAVRGELTGEIAPDMDDPRISSIRIVCPAALRCDAAGDVRNR